MTKNSSSFESVFILSEILIIILFGTCTKFGENTFPTADLSGEAEAIQAT
jgi:ammonium transporter Rh